MLRLKIWARGLLISLETNFMSSMLRPSRSTLFLGSKDLMMSVTFMGPVFDSLRLGVLGLIGT